MRRHRVHSDRGQGAAVPSGGNAEVTVWIHKVTEQASPSTKQLVSGGGVDRGRSDSIRRIWQRGPWSGALTSPPDLYLSPHQAAQ